MRSAVAVEAGAGRASSGARNGFGIASVMPEPEQHVAQPAAALLRRPTAGRAAVDFGTVLPMRS